MNVLDRKITQRGLTVFGGLFAAGVITGGIFMNTLDSSGNEKDSVVTPVFLTVMIDVTATGSLTAKSGQAYDAYCGPSPLVALGNASGIVIRARYDNITNPAGISGYIGFVEDCDDQTMSGAQLMSTLCTGTGCNTLYTTGTQAWPGEGNSGSQLKVTLIGVPTSAYDAKLVLWLEDNLGD